MDSVSFVYGLDFQCPTGGCVLQNNLYDLLRGQGIEISRYANDDEEKCKQFASWILEKTQNHSKHMVIFDGIALIRSRKLMSRLRNNFMGKIIALVHSPFSQPCYCDESWLKEVMGGTTNLFDEEMRLFRLVDNIIAVGNQTHKLMQETYGIRKDKVIGLFPFLSAHNMNLMKNQLSQRPSTTEPTSRIHFISVGSICKRKNQHEILDAVHRLSTRTSCELKLTLIGDISSEASYYEDLVKIKEKSPIQVDFTGSLEWNEAMGKVSQADCFLFASQHESFGLAPVEAAICGIPVISVCMDSLREVLSPETTLWVPNSTSPNWDEALDNFLLHQSKLHYIAKTKASCVLQKMSPDQAMQCLSVLFAQPSFSMLKSGKLLDIESQSISSPKSFSDTQQPQSPHGKSYRQAMTYKHAITMTFATLLSLATGSCLPIFFAYCYLIIMLKPPLSPANAVTILRTGSSIAVFYWYNSQHCLDQIHPLVLILSAVCFILLDILDGWLARRSKTGPTPIGGLLDIEGDSIAMLLLSLAAAYVVWIGAIIVGLLRYIYVIITKAGDLHTKKIVGGKGRWLAKYMAFFTVFALIGSIIWKSTLFSVLGVLTLVASFSVDFYQVWENHQEKKVKGLHVQV
mmetsp:Transcript_11658/g.15110  ORF Transcript_11658/g.15110 Transcript_11658/m.15110 type:complete len:629 (+) Transcript_11658:270-2156(+)